MAKTFSPTARQADLLRYIAGYQEAHDGISPSLAECGVALGISGKASLVRARDALAERGHLRILYGRARAIELLTRPPIPRGPDGAPLFFIPVHAASAN